MRELVRLTGDGNGFPPAALKPAGDGGEARGAVRQARKDAAWEKTLEYWKKKAAEGS